MRKKMIKNNLLLENDINKNSVKDENKINIFNQKIEIKNRHKKEKSDLKIKIQQVKKDFHLEQKVNFKTIKNQKNKKNYLKFELEQTNKYKNLKVTILNWKKELKIKQANELLNLKKHLLGNKGPIFVEKSSDKTSRLLAEKDKEKNKNKFFSKEQKEKTDYKTIFKNLPLRLYKEVKRIRWGSSDSQIFLKFFQVLIMIIACTLFIWGIEELFTVLLKAIKISGY